MWTEADASRVSLKPTGSFDTSIMSKVLVTGIGVTSSIGIGAPAFWKALLEGRTGLSRGTTEHRAVGVALVGCLEGDPALTAKTSQGRSTRERVSNRCFELLGVAAALADGDAELGHTPIEESRLGIVAGVGPIDQYSEDLLATAEHVRKTHEGGMDLVGFSRTALVRFSPLRRLRHLPNIGTALIAMAHHAGGPSLTLVGGVSCGLQAVIQGYWMVRSGRASAVLCGGADSRLSRTLLSQVARRWQLSACIDPHTACRPFDRTRDGIVPAEGGAVLLLESEPSAKSRGARAYAEILGGAIAGPSAEACEVAMRKALHVAKHRAPQALIAHGEGSQISDQLEAAAVRSVFGFSQREPLVTSIQGTIGHTMTAAGALNAVTASLALSSGYIPGIRRLGDPLDNLRFVTGNAVRARIDCIMTNALDPCGTAASALFAVSPL